MAQRKPDPAVVCVQPEDYHFCMNQCVWQTHALSFFAKGCNDPMSLPSLISCKLKLTVLQCTQAHVPALVPKENDHGEAAYSSGHH